MFNNVILIRFGELYLKGKNRSYFEGKLKSHITRTLSDIKCEVFFGRGRYVVKDYVECDELAIIEKLKKVFGLHSISVAKGAEFDIDSIAKTAAGMIPDSGTFRVTARRSQKNYALTSLQINQQVGEKLLELKPNLRVDLSSPDFVVNVDVRENSAVYVFTDAIACGGGMPQGTAGRGLLLLSGGIDSPVAGYMLAKRGIQLYALHFHSYPYTSEAAREKAMKLASELKEYTGYIKFMSVSLTKIQEEIHKCAQPNYMITLVRRFMMRIATIVAKQNECGCLINGESLGQVASQTMESITVTGAVTDLPVFRPLIGMDKDEIIEIAQKIGTFNTSIEPFEDCCTVFLPEYPVIKPTMERVLKEEAKLPDIDKLIAEALETLEVIKV